MSSPAVDQVLFAIIYVGFFLSVANLLISLINGRSSLKAQVKASSDLRALYQRISRGAPVKMRHFVTLARTVALERRATRR